MIRLRPILAATLCVLAATPVFAQVEYSVNNFFRYGNGRQEQGSGETKYQEYVENQTNLRLYWSNFTIGFQYQYDDPPEIGPVFQGIKQRFVEFSREDLELRLGDFYTLYGKGLALNLFEDRGINYDTKLDGFRGLYRNTYVKTTGAFGTMVYYDLVNYSRIERYSVRSGNIEVMPVEALRIGGSLVGAKGELPTVFVDTRGNVLNDQVQAEIAEAYFGFRMADFDLYAGWATKHSFGTRPAGGGGTTHFDTSGTGIYGSLGYTGIEGLGLTLEYKNYRFDPVDPDSRPDVNRPTRVLPMQNPPTVFREHSFYLVSRNPHVIDFNDELGLQLDMFYAATPQITVNLNGAVSSRQYAYEGTFGAWRQKNDDLLLPNMDLEYSPFYELYADVEWYFDGQSNLRIAFNRRVDNLYEEAFGGAHVISSTTIPMRVEYGLDEHYTVAGNLELQRFYDSAIRGKPGFENVYLAVTLSKSPEWAATVRGEFTTSEEDVKDVIVMTKNVWATAEFSYRLGSVHTATLSFGTERGGVVCSNGICRTVLPFDGVRFMLLTQL